MNVIDYYMKRGREQLAKLAMEPGDFYHRTSEHCEKRSRLASVESEDAFGKVKSLKRASNSNY